MSDDDPMGDLAGGGTMDLQDLNGASPLDMGGAAGNMEEEDDSDIQRTAAELEPVYDIPVQVSAILGKTSMQVADLLKLDTGTVVELDRKVGEAIDIYVNNRLVARGEVVVVESRLGVTMTEIIKAERA